MKNIKFIMTMSVLLISKISYSQISSNNFIGITWKVKEYYLNNVNYQNKSIDSLRYHFKENGILELNTFKSVEKAILNYTFNSRDSVLTIKDENLTETLFKIIYVDKNNFIYRISNTDELTGELLNSELRMVPE